MGLEEWQGTSPEELSPGQAQLLGPCLEENIPRSASARGDSSGNEGFTPRMLCSHPTVFPAQAIHRAACLGCPMPRSQRAQPAPVTLHTRSCFPHQVQGDFPSPLQAALRARLGTERGGCTGILPARNHPGEPRGWVRFPGPSRRTHRVCQHGFCLSVCPVLSPCPCRLPSLSQRAALRLCHFS